MESVFKTPSKLVHMNLLLVGVLVAACGQDSYELAAPSALSTPVSIPVMVPCPPGSKPSDPTPDIDIDIDIDIDVDVEVVDKGGKRCKYRCFKYRGHKKHKCWKR